METKNYKPKRLRTLLLENLSDIKTQILETKDFTHGNIDKLEEDIKTFVKHTIHSVRELGLKVDSVSFIGDLD